MWLQNGSQECKEPPSIAANAVHLQEVTLEQTSVRGDAHYNGYALSRFPHEEVTPAFGLGNDKRDYGRGFYLTESVGLAKEWAVCRPDESNGWVHRYELDLEDLRILDFQQHNVLAWLAELMKHRSAW